MTPVFCFSIKFLYGLYLFFFAGEYLGLTGEKLNGAEMISCGLATHYVCNEVKSKEWKKFVNSERENREKD